MKIIEVFEGTRCWKGYMRKGFKTMFGKRVPNCVKRENKFHETKEDIDLQKKFHSMYKFGHYCYGTAGKISAIFLRKYKYLL